MADWATKDEALIERIDGLLAAAPVRRKNMFGSSAWFLEANDMMFAGAWGEAIMVRVGAERTSALIEAGDAESFDPMGGKPMRIRPSKRRSYCRGRCFTRLAGRIESVCSGASTEKEEAPQEITLSSALVRAVCSNGVSPSAHSHQAAIDIEVGTSYERSFVAC